MMHGNAHLFHPIYRIFPNQSLEHFTTLCDCAWMMRTILPFCRKQKRKKKTAKQKNTLKSKGDVCA